MLSVQVQRCSILHEFDREQQHKMFGISRDKTLHHIDTLYYSVFINEPDHVVQLQSEDKLPENLTRFIRVLREMKAEIKSRPGINIDLFDDLEAVGKSFSMYEFCVSLNECFDIFISSYLPNEDTPRVVVQLRSRYLVLKGVRYAVETSFSYLKEFLAPFGLFPVKVRENRIDYAFHTNLIQNPYKFFSDDNLLKHLKTNLRTFSKFGSIGEDGIELETLNLGNRKSNNVYFRGYNKCQEVIRLNYKAFFIDRWYEEGLISEFDKFVYETAYELKSYRTGCLVGRLKWYLANGSDIVLLDQCQKLLDSDFIKSDNCSHIEKKIHNVIPEPTLIFNIEYQTKRKFYSTCSSFVGCFTDLSEMKMNNMKLPVLPEANPEVCGSGSYDPLLKNLYMILGNARTFVDYLTEYGNAVSFVEDRKLSRKDFLEAGEPYQNWWKRIRSTPIQYSSDKILDLYREYDLNANLRKSRRLFQGQVARLSMLKNQDLEDRSFVEDMSDVLCVLNDNDLPPFIPNPVLEQQIDPIEYGEIRKRKARQLRGIIEKEKNQNAE